MSKIKIYTKTGDKGETSLWSGKRVKKHHPRLSAYGDMDELNSSLGICKSHCHKVLSSQIHEIQSVLFLCGSYLSCDQESLLTNLPDFKDAFSIQLEAWLDKMEEDLSELKNFILPSGKNASFLHLSRSICRRAERSLVVLEEDIHKKDKILIYLNRLSDYLFVASRWQSLMDKETESIWQASNLK